MMMNYYFSTNYRFLSGLTARFGVRTNDVGCSHLRREIVFAKQAV